MNRKGPVIDRAFCVSGPCVRPLPDGNRLKPYAPYRCTNGRSFLRWRATSRFISLPFCGTGRAKTGA